MFWQKPQKRWREVSGLVAMRQRVVPREIATAPRLLQFRLKKLSQLLSELAENTMGSFFCRRDKDAEERWWLEVLGKGDKERLAPATNEMMVELIRYRRELGLAPCLAPSEETPLVVPIGKSRKSLTRAARHAIVKRVFDGAADRLRLRGDEFAPRADLLERASAHWLRHTAGSHMADPQIAHSDERDRPHRGT